MNRLLLIFIALAFSVQAEAVTLKIATVAPEGSGWMKEMKASAQEIKERTDGRVQFKYYGGGVKGNDKQVLRLIRIGQLQGGAFTPSALTSEYEDLNLYGLPMVFDSEEEAAYARSRLLLRHDPPTGQERPCRAFRERGASRLSGGLH